MNDKEPSATRVPGCSILAGQDLKEKSEHERMDELKLASVMHVWSL